MGVTISNGEKSNPPIEVKVVVPDSKSTEKAPKPVVRVRASWTAGEWKPVAMTEAPNPLDPEDGTKQENRRRIGQIVRSVVDTDQLASLFGLGPSAGVGGPKMGDLWKLVQADDTTIFSSLQKKVGDTTPANLVGDIEEFLSRCQALANGPAGADSEATKFIASAEKVITKACREFLPTADLSAHEHLLRMLGRRSSGKSRTRVFTTNYDLCIEKAAANSGLLLIDGFGRETPPAFDGSNFDIDLVRRRPEAKSPDYLDGVLHLVKLHGSIDWDKEGNQVLRREHPKEPLLIYPRRDKFELSYRQPFLESISQLQTTLRQPSLGLLVVGFSFSDAHLSEMILSAVRKNLGLRLVIATLGCARHCDEKDESFRKPLRSLMDLLDHGDSRITLIDCDFSSLVRLVPDVGTETEEERLRNAIRSLLK